jgi:hypothetical protein
MKSCELVPVADVEDDETGFGIIGGQLMKGELWPYLRHFEVCYEPLLAQLAHKGMS